MIVRYIENGNASLQLTVGKMYDVIEYIKSSLRSPDYDIISIIDDKDRIAEYWWYHRSIPIFEDVTAEYRTSVIDEILL